MALSADFVGKTSGVLTQFKYASLDPDLVEMPKNVCCSQKMITLIKVILYSYLILKKMNKRITDS